MNSCKAICTCFFRYAKESESLGSIAKKIYLVKQVKKKTCKGEISPIRKDNKIELGASCFGTNTLPFPCTYTIAENSYLVT